MSGFKVKFLAMVLIFTSVYLFYLYQRLEYARSRRKNKFHWTFLSRYSPYHSRAVNEAREAWNYKFPITISYSADGCILNQAERLYNSGYDHTNIFTVQKFDICETDHSNCITTDLRIFLHEYFEAFSRPYLKKTDSKNVFYIPNDIEILASDYDFDKYRVFGGMYALALITDTYLGMIFLDFNWCESSRILNHIRELEKVDNQQYQIYTEISRARNRNTSYNNSHIFGSTSYTQFLLGPSPKPFQRAELFNYLNTYSAHNYPLEEAARRALIHPFKGSREAIHAGSRHYLGVENITFANDYDFSASCNSFDFDATAFVLMWRDNAICNSPQCQKFWRAMSMLTADKIFRIYQNISGYQTFPLGGFNRFPKTEIVCEGGPDWFPRRFKINLYSEFTVAEMYEILKETPPIFKGPCSYPNSNRHHY